jgi:hypothetical protein
VHDKDVMILSKRSSLFILISKVASSLSNQMELILDLPSIRSLRGGSGGGGKGGSSGGYSGGGSYSSGSRGTGTNGRLLPIWFYSSHGSNGSSESDRIATWVWVTLVVIIVLICGCCCYYREFGRKSSNGGEKIGTQVDVEKDPDFDAAVAEARRGLAYTSSPHSCNVRYQTYGGTFDSTYNDRGETFTATLNLRLTNDGLSGYTIEGEGSDNDGVTNVVDGFITYNGNAWWLEETVSGRDAGLKVLTRGTFDFSNNTFSGTWKSSSRYEGNYISFVGRDITKSFDSSHGNDENIPVVTAQAEESIPVVFAVGEPVNAVPQATAFNGGKKNRNYHDFLE